MNEQSNIDWKKYHLENEGIHNYSKIIKRQAEILQPESVLEVGCGMGYNLNEIPNNIPRFGIDIESSVIKKAQQLFPYIFFLPGDILEPKTKNRFDLVYSVGVLEHIIPENIMKAMYNMYSLSKKYILSIEAYSLEGEKEINWHRGPKSFWAYDTDSRWRYFPVKIIRSFPINSEYWMVLCQRL